MVIPSLQADSFHVPDHILQLGPVQRVSCSGKQPKNSSGVNTKTGAWRIILSCAWYADYDAQVLTQPTAAFDNGDIQEASAHAKSEKMIDAR